ncbi:unnamed protein product [Vicia faba]|uniref:Uncharacterized protein n=1 Tax=Vicia faba TaxID=3906 RepID=A0AAV0ZK87_VICFA|nr:unnamed protein product [Vicia faba]
MTRAHMMYIRIFRMLGLLSRREFISVKCVLYSPVWNDLCEMIKFLFSFDKRKGERTLNVCFFVIPCKNVCNNIFGRLFLATLDMVAFLIHLKMKYYNNTSKLIDISIYLYGIHFVHNVVMRIEKNFQTINTVNLDLTMKHCKRICLAYRWKLNGGLKKDFKRQLCDHRARR